MESQEFRMLEFLSTAFEHDDILSKLIQKFDSYDLVEDLVNSLYEKGYTYANVDKKTITDNWKINLKSR